MGLAPASGCWNREREITAWANMCGECRGKTESSVPRSTVRALVTCTGTEQNLSMKDRNLERDLGEQPLVRLMAERDLKPQDLVAASTEQLTHKMVTRAMKGRRLTANTMSKVQRAWNLAASSENGLGELFNYVP